VQDVESKDVQHASFLDLAQSPVKIAELRTSAARLGVPSSAPVFHEDSLGKDRLTCPKIGGKEEKKADCELQRVCTTMESEQLFRRFTGGSESRQRIVPSTVAAGTPTCTVVFPTSRGIMAMAPLFSLPSTSIAFHFALCVFSTLPVHLPPCDPATLMAHAFC